MRVVIIGGTGNISRGVVRALLEHGHEVTMFNRGQTDGPTPPGVRVIRGDRKDYPAFEERMRAERFDAAIDMICFTAEEAESDVRAFRGVKHFIQTSTAAVFGGPLAEYPTNEDSPRRPVIPYGINKVAADDVFGAAAARGDLPLTTFMPAQTWGYQPRLLRQLGRDSRWIDRIRRGLPVLISHDGQLVWAECHADDVGVAYGAALGRARCIGQTYLVTRPGLHTWRDYYQGMADALGKPLRLVDAPADFLIRAWPENTELLASESRWNRIYDLTRIQRDIPEFRPTITLAEAGGALVRRLDETGNLPDAMTDQTEDRLIRQVESLGLGGEVAR